MDMYVANKNFNKTVQTALNEAVENVAIASALLCCAKHNSNAHINLPLFCVLLLDHGNDLSKVTILSGGYIVMLDNLPG